MIFVVELTICFCLFHLGYTCCKKLQNDVVNKVIFGNPDQSVNEVYLILTRWRNRLNNSIITTMWSKTTSKSNLTISIICYNIIK